MERSLGISGSGGRIWFASVDRVSGRDVIGFPSFKKNVVILLKTQNPSKVRGIRFEQWMHNRKFGMAIAVVPERWGIDLFGVGDVVPAVSDTLGVLPRRLNGSEDVTSQEEE